MPKIKRYDVDGPEIESPGEGDFVKYTDHAAEVNMLERELRIARNLLTRCEALSSTVNPIALLWDEIRFFLKHCKPN